ncbi:hypothetical protein [Vampirovibrio chlorellavorus]|uniref:hypothetical protein n=1 Tax=Vampirovibrio chlorellavorus TaxID=758823 RepID=UPI0026F1C6EB|nr:hypothetical protein [Vampirovibrio chlorellavorus]
MDPLSPLSQRILRFSGVQPQVLRQLEAERLKQDSTVLFGENLDVFIKQNQPAKDGQENGTSENSAIIELVTNKKDSRALAYGSGFIRNLHRMLTGEDIPPTEVVNRIRKESPSGDIFEMTRGSDN